VITLETIREHLGERAAKKLSIALEPKLSRDTVEGARRYVSGVPGDRIRRLKDRAAFAAAMARLIQADPNLRRWALRALGDSGKKGPVSTQDSSDARGRRRGRRSKRAA
jgi:hypothetical protein